jgi:hypothetical protein
VLFCLAYLIVRKMFALLALVLRRDVSKEAELLVLRRETRCCAAISHVSATNLAGAENFIHAAQAACSYSWMMPARRSRRRMSSRARAGICDRIGERV